jgi:protease-4
VHAGPIGASGRRPAARLRTWGAGALLALCGTLAGCGPTSFLITPVPARHELEEHVLLRESLLATRKLVVLDVDGVLANERTRKLLGPDGENPVALFKEKLDRAAADPAVRAVVLRLNTPGGGVTASDLMYAELLAFRQRTGKPVIASMLDVAASGGYYVACGADQIYATPTTITGSIGVIAVFPEFSGTMQKLGISVNAIKSGPMKDAGSPFRPMSDREREQFQAMITQMYERFVAVVHRHRAEIPLEELRELADGRVFLGEEARAAGLVDHIGTVADALRGAKAAAGLADRKVLVVQYARPPAYRANVYAEAPAVPAQVNLVNLALPDWLDSPAPRFLYLWAPGW